MSNSKTVDPHSPMDIDLPLIIMASAHQDNNEIDKLCAPCIESKSTWVVRQKKAMTLITKKLEEMHGDFWGPHNPLS